VERTDEIVFFHQDILQPNILTSVLQGRRQSSSSAAGSVRTPKAPTNEQQESDDCVDILVIDHLRCPSRVRANRRAVRSSPLLCELLHAAPPPRPPDFRPEIMLDDAAPSMAELRPYTVIQVYIRNPFFMTAYCTPVQYYGLVFHFARSL
jgi:hypothetical protein